MKKIGLDSKVSIKLNENGKHFYYVCVEHGDIVNSELRSDGTLVASLEEIINLFGEKYSNIIPINLFVDSDKMYIEDEGKIVSLDAMILVQLTDFGKQLYYLNMMGEEYSKGIITKDDYLLISIRDLVRIFGGNLNAVPFENEELLVKKEFLMDQNQEEMVSKR